MPDANGGTSELRRTLADWSGEGEFEDIDPATYAVHDPAAWPMGLEELARLLDQAAAVFQSTLFALVMEFPDIGDGAGTEGTLKHQEAFRLALLPFQEGRLWLDDLLELPARDPGAVRELQAFHAKATQLAHRAAEFRASAQQFPALAALDAESATTATWAAAIVNAFGAFWTANGLEP